MPTNAPGRALPRELGFRMPAEWEPHHATWLSWPHNPNTWPNVDIEKIEHIWAQMTAALCPGEIVNILAAPERHEQVRKVLKKQNIPLERVKIHAIPTNDAWVRDAGPIFVVRDEGSVRVKALTNWEFNMWGGKYPPWDLDNQIPLKVADHLGLQAFSTGIILEGGSIDVNGRGTLLTTEQCLLNKNRNSHLKREEIENYLTDYLNVTQILWLGEGIEGDDTDGHVDDITRFTAPDTIVTVVEDDPVEENNKILQENLRKLQSFKDPAGKSFKIHTLPMPKPIFHTDGMRLPASYGNFYIANGTVLLPIFGDKKDETAIATVAKLFPDRKIAPIRCEELVVGLGGIHCVTQQEPA